ncbi:MAG: serine/threonine protein kinase [Myxococcota bacterium]|jgi:serine/threonine protein kinase
MLDLTVRRTFRFGRCLGRGGFGEVYRATMRSGGGLESAVAVKVLRVDLDADTDAVRRLRDEGRLLARLNHPNILTVYDLVLLDGRVALVTEFVDGADLDACLSCDPPLGARALVDLVGQVAAALHAAWETPGRDGEPLRIVHRDLKPSNVRIGRHGQVRLLDFGIAHFEGTDREARTASDLVVGSVPFMAPERFFSRGTQGPADVFGLGCLLYEGITGERFLGVGDVRLITRIALSETLFSDRVHQAVARLTDQPPALRDLVGACLSYDPASRPTAAEVSERCDAMLDDLSGPSLRSWARAWPVTVDGDVTGPLEGRVISEGSLGLPSAPGLGATGHVEELPKPTRDLGEVAADAVGLAARLVPGDVVRAVPSPPTLLPPPSRPRPAPTVSRMPSASSAALAAGCAMAGLTLAATVTSMVALGAWAWFG